MAKLEASKCGSILLCDILDGVFLFSAGRPAAGDLSALRTNESARVDRRKHAKSCNNPARIA